MKCLECDKTEFTIDERLGEKVCDNCGFVHVEEIFERTVSNYTYESGEPVARQIVNARQRLGTERPKPIEQRWEQSIKYMLAIASEFKPTQRLKNEMAHNYSTLVRARVLKGATMEERVGAIIFFTYRENNMAISVKDIAKHCDATTHRISKIARKIARHFNRPWVLSQIHYEGEFERIALDCGKEREFISDAINVHLTLMPFCAENNIVTNKGYVGAVMYITGKLREDKIRQQDLCKLLETQSVRRRYREIVNSLNVDFGHITVDEFVSGAYMKCERY